LAFAVFWAWLVAAGGAIAVCCAQEPSAKNSKDYALIYGTVWGADDRPAAGVPVTIRRATDKKPKWELVSDSRGEFAQRVPPGRQDYIVRAAIKAPQGEAQPEVTVQIEGNERKDIGLHLTVAAPAKK
jgi:hypothetical protein